jgi:hypothetical protein
MNYTLRHRVTEGVVAAAPVAAVLLAFSLLLTLLRQSRTHAQAPARPAPVDIPALPAAATAAPIALPAAPATAHGPNDAAPTREVPVLADADQPTAGAPTGPAAPVQDEPAPPTVQVPALSPEPPTVPPRPQRAIRYAGNGVPGMAGNQQAAGPDPVLGDTVPGEDYWANEEAGQFAGLVYPAREEHAEPGDDADDSNDDGDSSGPGDSDDGDDSGDAGDSADDESAPRQTPPELDDDAPPFATAPFAPVPRLNRVRSSPTPPADEEG